MTGSKPAIFLLFLLLFLVFPVPESQPGSLPRVQRTVLPNGLVLLLSEEHSLPLVIFEMVADAGSRRDPAGQEGLAHLTAKGLLLGTSTHDEKAMNEALDFLGASLSASATRDYSVLRLEVLKKDLDQGLALFLGALTKPVFPEEELRKQAQKTLGDIEAADEQPMALAEKTFRQALFPNSPYGHPVAGTRESVPTLHREEVLRFFQAYYRPNGAVLAIVGDIAPEELKRQIVPALSNWPAGGKVQDSFEGKYAQRPDTITIDRQISQANIILGNIGVNRDSPDYYPLTVMNYLLGGGAFESYLMQELRVKRGLVYSVRSYFDAEKYQGSFQVILQTKNSSASESIDIARRQIKAMQTTPVPDGDLARAKSYLTGSFPLRLDSQSKLASFIASVEFYGLGMDYLERYPSLINAVTKEDVLRVANAYLHPEQAILVIVANLKDAGIGQQDRP